MNRSETLDSLAREINRIVAADPLGSQASVVHGMIDGLCETFAVSPLAEREAMPALEPAVRPALLDYAWRMAQQAVRNSDPSAVTRGLTALVVESGRMDIRDSIMRMAVLYHSAVALGLEPVGPFERAAQLSGNETLARELRAFPVRRPEAREIAAFHVRALGSGEGFRYEVQAEGGRGIVSRIRDRFAGQRG